MRADKVARVGDGVSALAHEAREHLEYVEHAGVHVQFRRYAVLLQARVEGRS